MIASVLNLLYLVAALSDRGQHQIVSHYLNGFNNYEFWKRGTRFVTLKSHCAIYFENGGNVMAEFFQNCWGYKIWTCGFMRFQVMYLLVSCTLGIVWTVRFNFVNIKK